MPSMPHSPPRRSPPPWLLVLLYALLGVAPLIIAAALHGRERDVQGELAVGAGLVALAMLLVQFISSGRFEGISGRAGIDRTLRFHQLGAYGLLLLAVLHPLLFMFSRDPADWLRLPRQFFMLASSSHLLSGTIALVLLIALVPAAIYRTRLALRYEAWRGLHVLLAVGAGVAGLHHALSVGGYSGETALKVFWVLLAAAAMGSLAYGYLVKPVLLSRSAWRVKSNESAGDGIRRLVLEPGGRGLDYQAGQFVWVNFGHRPFPIGDHPYSLASSPLDGRDLSLLIKARGDFSSAAGSIPVGAVAYVDGPHGDFVLAGREAASVALFAGGIGIAPILGILRDMQLSGDSRPVSLVYGARNAERLAGREAINEAAGVLDLSVDYVLENPPPHWQGSVGGISPEVVARAIKGRDPRHCICMLCGPTAMMLATERVLLDAGVPARNIVYERFDYD